MSLSIIRRIQSKISRKLRILKNKNKDISRKLRKLKSKNKNIKLNAPLDCYNCRFFYGKKDGNNFLVCGIHAYGQENCVDFKAQKRKTPKIFILIQNKWSEQWTILWFFLHSLTEIGSIILYISGNLDWENIIFINLLIPGLVFVTFLYKEIW